MGFWRKLVTLKKKEQKKMDGKEEDLPHAVVVTDVLDLHGFFPEQVPEMLQAFLDNAQELGIRTLRIIHGKGKSKLKWVVCKELEKYPIVSSYMDAPPEFGGWGATMVYLKLEKTDVE